MLPSVQGCAPATSGQYAPCLSKGESRPKPYFPALDGLRAVSILLVIAAHVRQKWKAGDAGIFDWLHGGQGVTIFFVLSGFLITTLAVREVQATGALDFRAFYIRRVFRLFPLYYLVLGAYVALVLGLHADPRQAEFRDALPYYLTYMQEWPSFFRAVTPPFALSWSLGIEEKFYMLWPLAAFGAIRTVRGRWIAAGVSLAGTLLLPRMLAASPAVVEMLADYGAIAMGCAVALAVSGTSTTTIANRFAHPAVPLFSLAAMVAGRGSIIVSAAATALAIPALAAQAGALARALSSQAAVWVGQRSYAIYLIHLLCLSIARSLLRHPDSALGDLALFLVALAITLPVAGLAHVVVEAPGIRLGRKISTNLVRGARMSAM